MFIYLARLRIVTAALHKKVDHKGLFRNKLFSEDKTKDKRMKIK